MSVLVNKDSKIIVQGFTGSEGTFHAGQMIEYGTNVVGGVTPGKGGQVHLDKPVFNTVKEAVDKVDADTTIIFVPPAFAADAIMEAADAGIKVIITITEGIPVADMIKASDYIKSRDCRLIGPNCPGVITPGEAKVGIMPGFVFKKGKVGVVSKSGTLTYEAADQVVKQGLGITTAIGIGGDPIIGTTTKEAVELLKQMLHNGIKQVEVKNLLLALLLEKLRLQDVQWDMLELLLVAVMIQLKLKNVSCANVESML